MHIIQTIKKLLMKYLLLTSVKYNIICLCLSSNSDYKLFCFFFKFKEKNANLNELNKN